MLRATRIACRLCRTRLGAPFLDLGKSPLAGSLLPPEYALRMEPFYPLAVYACPKCWLVQLPKTVSPARIFRHAGAGSSAADRVDPEGRFVERLAEERKLGPGSCVVELASGDGRLLELFRARGAQVLGIEPAASAAAAAEERGIPTRVAFFGARLASALVEEGLAADLVVANTVFAQVPDLNDFVGGLKAILKPGGLATLEFPHLLALVADVQFDTIYHEHYSYFSLVAASAAFRAHGLSVVDVEELPARGGTLRVHVTHAGARASAPAVEALIEREREAGLTRGSTFAAFGEAVARIKHDLLALLIDLKRQGKRVAGYGAAAKGATLLNYCGIRTDILEFIADKSPHKQGQLMPGVHVPVVSPDVIRTEKPDVIMILPRNRTAEITAELADAKRWGARFLVSIPRPELTT